MGRCPEALEGEEASLPLRRGVLEGARIEPVEAAWLGNE